MSKIINIAIDGPAGSGKSTIAKIIAKKLNITYLDTGSMYRAFTYYALENNVESDDKENIIKLLENIDLVLDKDEIFVNGKNVTKEIRFENIDKNVSKYAAINGKYSKRYLKRQKRYNGRKRYWKRCSSGCRI